MMTTMAAIMGTLPPDKAKDRGTAYSHDIALERRFAARGCDAS